MYAINIKTKQIESSTAAESIWTIQRSSRLSGDRVIRRYETTDYTLAETFYPAKSPGVIDGKNDFYPTAAHYIFADKAGNNLFLIKNIIDLASDRELNTWSVQKTNINK